jgi:hypothetical protein
MHRHLRTIAAIFGGSALALIATVSVLGYAGQVAATVSVSAPSGPQTCGLPLTISATIQETGGALISGQPVAWSFSAGAIAGDKILTANSTTNASGVASTQIQLACSAHSVTVAAVADDVTGTVVVQSSGKGLPRTDTAPTTSFLAIALAALAVLVGSGAILRRMALGRR